MYMICWGMEAYENKGRMWRGGSVKFTWKSPKTNGVSPSRDALDENRFPYDTSY